LGRLEIDFLRWIQSLEEEFQRGQRVVPLKGPKEKAILLSVGQKRPGGFWRTPWRN